MRKIKPQFPSTPDGNLMSAVIEQAINDLVHNRKYKNYKHARSAKKYLDTDMPHALACGIDPDWIRKQISQYHY